MPSTPAPIVGIDLGGTNIQIGLVEHHGDTPVQTASVKRKTKAALGADAVLDRIAQGVVECCDKASVTPSDLAAIGIGAPGPADPYRGIVFDAVNLAWRDMPLAAELRTRLGPPIYVDNDVNAALVGEAACGAGAGADSLLGVWVGTGVGGALIFNRQLYHGHFYSAGEVGHMHAFPASPPGSRTLEYNCSRTAMVEHLTRLIRTNRTTILTDLVQGDLSKLRSSVIAKAYHAGDELTREVVDHAADLLGAHIGSLQTLLSVERIILGGGATEAIGQPFVRRVHTHARRVAFPAIAKEFQLVASSLEDRAGVLGMAALARQRLGDERFCAG